MKKVKLFSGIVILIAISHVLFSQNPIDSSFIKKVYKNNKEFTLGLYGGGNYSWVQNSLEAGVRTSGNYGQNLNFITQLRLPGNLSFYSGIEYSMLSYKMSIKTNASNISNDAFIFTFKNAYLAIPLSIGKTSNNGKWSYGYSIGIEFYYNYKNKGILFDSTLGKTVQQTTFYRSHTYSTSDYYKYGFPTENLINLNWYGIGAFGILNGYIGYKVNQKWSISLMAGIKFTNPFNSTPQGEPFAESTGQETIFWGFGGQYHFTVMDIGGSLSPTDVPHKISIGFCINPIVSINQGYGSRVSFSYSIPLRIKLSDHIWAETGLLIDNYNYFDDWTTATFIGVPLGINYCFNKNEKSGRTFYLGAGMSFDYPTNDGGFYQYGKDYIVPMAFIRGGGIKLS